MAGARLALVTGSTSGIGEAIAYGLSSKGYNMALTGFGSEQQIQAVVNKCSRRGSYVSHFSADLSSPVQIEELFHKVREKFDGGPDILVNNAGMQHVASIEEFATDKWNDVIAVNLSASFHTIKLALKGMKLKGWGRIINVSSAHGLVASPYKSAYCASKHGLIGLTKAVALETAGTGVTCNAICPGWVFTPLVKPQIDAIVNDKGCEFDEAKKILLTKQPSKEFVLPEEIASTVSFLCSEGAKQITGTSISIDGGWTTQ